MIHPDQLEDEGMQSEEMNCLEEARYFCATLNKPMAIAPFVVNKFVSYFCRSTDGFAGNYLSFSKGFSTESEAKEFAAKLQMEDEESTVEVLPRGIVVPTVVEKDDCPF